METNLYFEDFDNLTRINSQEPESPSTSDSLKQIKLQLKLEAERKSFKVYMEEASKSALKIQQLSDELLRLVQEKKRASSTPAQFEPVKQPKLEITVPNPQETGLASPEISFAVDSPTTEQPKESTSALEAQPTRQEPYPALNIGQSRSFKHSKTEVCANFFNRKPRNILLNPFDTYSELITTSSLDGHIQFSEATTGGVRKVQDIYHSVVQNYFTEDMCWVSKNCIALASAMDSRQESLKPECKRQQVALLHSIKSGYKNQIGYKIQHLDQLPHRGSVSSICSISSDSDFAFVTGGSDHKIMHWSAQKEWDHYKVNVSGESLHSGHTSSVSSIYYDDYSIWSGGPDRKLIKYDLRHKSLSEPLKLDGPINFITGMNHKHNQLLVSVNSGNKDQLRILDKNSKHFAMVFGLKEDSWSKYTQPFVHQSGNYVAMGEPVDYANPRLLIWDIRYIKDSVMIECHSKFYCNTRKADFAWLFLQFKSNVYDIH